MGYDERYEKIRTALLKRRFYLGLFVFLPLFFSMFALAAPLIFLTKLRPVLQRHTIDINEIAAIYRSAEQWTYIFTAAAIITGLVVAYGLIMPARKLLKDIPGDIEEFSSLGKEFTKIAASFRNYSHLIGSTTGGIIALDRDGKITMANPHACHILGLPEADLAGENINRFIGITGDFETAIRGEVVTSELNAAINRESRTIGYTLSPVRGKNTIDGAVLNFIDTTKIKEMHDEIQKTERLAGIGALAMEVAHEIRNPLASIKGLIQLIGEEIEEGDKRKLYIAAILKETERLNRVVDSLFQRSSSIAHEENLRDMVHRIVLLCSQAAGGKNVKVREEYDEKTEWMAIRDESLFHAVYNIVLNAYEAVKENGSINITAKSSGMDTIIEVSSDSELGPGITADRIFEGGVTTKGVGHGMGLKIAKDAIRKIGGDIDVETSGVKTKFIIRLLYYPG